MRDRNSQESGGCEDLASISLSISNMMLFRKSSQRHAELVEA
jgi:hypothetical protein